VLELGRTFACLHAAAALAHHLVLEDRMLTRMLPGSKQWFILTEKNR